MSPSWLPDLLLLDNFGGNWDNYLAELYRHYEAYFMKSKPVYNGVRLMVKKHPFIQGKEATFWHIISEGSSEEHRIPDLRRCERIRWPKAVIEHNTHPGIKIWQNRRGSETGICIWFEEKEYLVVLRARTGYILFMTAYPVTQNHSKRKLEAEYQAYKMARAALSDGSVTPST
ncbi:MAG TPA: hypothetical protein DCL44_07740 [Elusimicrobia bacterium]|nr:hypothetical protein [Elusimicrobiota bacterium]